MPGFIKKTICLFLAVATVALSACSSDAGGSKLLDFGSYGEDWALSFAAEHPFRSPYSEEEKQAAAAIKKELDALGIRYEVQSFADPDDSSATSENIIVRFDGNGFRMDPENPDTYAFLKNDPSTDSTYAPGVTRPSSEQETGPAQDTAPTVATQPFSNAVVQRQIIFGAHYDTKPSLASREETPDFNGIHDNAAGVAALLAAAKEIKRRGSPFDVTLVFFGARYDGLQGSVVFADSIRDKADEIEAVYVVEGIYAGQSLYTHSGRNSLIEGQKYLMRRRLYEVTDIVLKDDVQEILGVNCYTNQAGFSVEVGQYGTHIYREFTLSDADYVPFDGMGIPCVFFQSYSYVGENLDEMKESALPAFSASNGQVANTNSDNIEYLKENLPENQLRKRINTVAYLLYKITQNGVAGYKAA